LHKYGLPPVHVHGAAILHSRGGWCRHGDLGAAGGGHLQCPTTDPAKAGRFAQLVAHEHTRAGFRHEWGRE
jgi:hypothetical protein